MFKMLNSKHRATVLLALLFLTLLLGYGLVYFTVSGQPPQSSATVKPAYKIIYLASDNALQIEHELTVERFLEDKKLLEKHDLSLEAASDWQVVENSLLNQDLDALILHHSAISEVNVQELQTAMDKGLVVTGIGIPGLELAELLGDPALFTSVWSPDEGYTTPYYFYTYSYNVEGEQQDINSLRKNGSLFGENSANTTIDTPLSIEFSASTDTLLNKDFSAMFSTIRAHIINRGKVILNKDNGN